MKHDPAIAITLRAMRPGPTLIEATPRQIQLALRCDEKKRALFFLALRRRPSPSPSHD